MKKFKLSAMLLFAAMLVFSACGGGGGGSDDPGAPGDGDNTPPIAGNNGNIDVSNVGQSSLTLNWTIGSDNLSSTSSLTYAVYRSNYDNIADVESCEANGIKIMDYTSDVAVFNATKLPAGNLCYYNVIVKDSVGNKNSYAGISQLTLPPVKIEWVRTAWPNDLQAQAGTIQKFYGQVYTEGVTSLPSANDGIIAQFGYGERNTSAILSTSWKWFNASYNDNPASGLNDEYVCSLQMPSPGSYHYAFRFSGDGGNTWYYGDIEDGAGAYFVDGKRYEYFFEVSKQGELTVIN